jgi:heme a synthase
MAGSLSRALPWAAVVAVFLLMTIGNVVSATGSGLACPDWPLCHGRLIPPFEPEVLIEYSHRLTAALTSILLVATVVVTVATAASRGARRVAVALLVLFGIQIGLGGITVLLKLPTLISTAHLVNALLILAGLLLLAARPEAGAPDLPASPRMVRLIMAGLAVLLVQLALGGYVRHAGAGLGCASFPLCNAGFFPEHWLGSVHWVHRWLGVILLGLFLHLAAAGRGTPLAQSANLVAALAVVQVGLGVTAVLMRLDPPVRALHAMVGYALWGTLVWLSVRAGCWPRLLGGAPASRARARAGVAHA